MCHLLLSGFLFLAAVANAAHIRQSRSLTGRIIGGEDTTIEQHPYQVSLFGEDGPLCGGSIISKYYVLTAAHCVVEIGPFEYGDYHIRAGSTIRNLGGSVHAISSAVTHADYYENNKGIPINDVGLIRVVQPFEFDVSRRPVQLYEANEATKVGEPAVVTGWGYNDDNILPDVLQAVTVPIVSKKLCAQAYGDLPHGQMCAGYYEEGEKDACGGDSGGPLIVAGKLAGIVSWGGGCALPKNPGVYTEVAYFRKWINQHSKV